MDSVNTATASDERMASDERTSTSPLPEPEVLELFFEFFFFFFELCFWALTSASLATHL